MYEITIKDSKFTIPKKNLLALAQVKALDCCCLNFPKTEAEAVEFFASNGMKINEIEEV